MKSRKIVFMVLCIFLVSSLGLVAEPKSADQTPRILVLGAFEAEQVIVRDHMTVQQTTVINGRTYYEGTLYGKKIVLGLSGVSMINAAMSAQTLIDHYNITHIIFTGIAGGVDPTLNIGDVVVGTSAAQYQEMLAARYTGPDPEPLDGDASLYDIGWHQQILDNYGFWFPQTVGVTRDDDTNQQEMLWFDSDPTMLAVAISVLDDVQLAQCTPGEDPVCLDYAPKLVIGPIVSGQTFVDNANYRMWVYDNYGAAALDMETAAVAHVAHTNRIPFIAFRSLSDLAGGGPGGNQIGIFFALAANNAASAFLTFFEALAEQI